MNTLAANTLTLTTISQFAVYSKTPDGIGIRVTIKPDIQGLHHVTVTGPGYMEMIATSAVETAMDRALVIVAKMRNRQAIAAELARAAVVGPPVCMTTDTISSLVHLRAEIIRVAHEVDALADLAGIADVRRKAPLVAERLRSVAMTQEMKQACERRLPL